MQLEQIKQLDAQYYMNVFGERFPVCFVDGEGNSLIDTQGKKYLDFLAGIAVNCQGYSDEGFKAALKNCIDHVIHTSNYFYIETQAQLAEKICQMAHMDRVFFANSGAEAMEGAIKLARKYAYEKGNDQSEIICFHNSFHGRTLATLTATGQEKFHKGFGPLVKTFYYADYNDLESVKKLITPHTSAILLEPIIGEGGVIPATPEFLQGLEALCHEQDILLIIDEIQTGMGRSGEFLAYMNYGVQPDITVMAKALGGGVPIGAFLATEKVASAFQPADHGSTFGGNPLATTAGLYMLNWLTPQRLQQVRQLGEYFMRRLKELQAGHPAILDVRGMGLMIAAQLDGSVSCKGVLQALLAQGIVIGTAGGNCLRFLPPYTITTDEIDDLMAHLHQVLANFQ